MSKNPAGFIMTIMINNLSSPVFSKSKYTIKEYFRGNLTKIEEYFTLSVTGITSIENSYYKTKEGKTYRCSYGLDKWQCSLESELFFRNRIIQNYLTEFYTYWLTDFSLVGEKTIINRNAICYQAKVNDSAIIEFANITMKALESFARAFNISPQSSLQPYQSIIEEILNKGVVDIICLDKETNIMLEWIEKSGNNVVTIATAISLDLTPPSEEEFILPVQPN
jgi:hypothetical protein